MSRTPSVLFTCLFAFASWCPAQEPAAAEREFPADWTWHRTEEQWAKHAALIGKPMPALDLADWMNGQVDLESLEGKVVVVDFWATWCGPCIKSIPHNNELVEAHGDDLVFIGVCGSARGQEKMAQVVEEHGVKYPVARDHEQKSAPAWGVMWWPTYAVVDRTGTVRIIGLKPDHVDAVVEKLLAEGKDGDAAAKPAAGGEIADPKPIPEEWLEKNPNRETLLAEITGKPAPALQVADWMHMDATTLAEMKGKVVMLDFWATWCGPCIKSIPHNNELYAKYKDQGLVVLGVCHPRGGEDGKMKASAEEHGIEYPIAYDANGTTIAAYGVNSFPDYYFIDRAGNLRIADCSNGSVDQAIELLLAETLK